MNQGSPLSAYCLRHRVGLRLPRFPGRTNHCNVSTAGVSRQRSTYCYVPPMGARDQGLHRKHPIELSHNLTFQQILPVFEFHFLLNRISDSPFRVAIVSACAAD